MHKKTAAGILFALLGAAVLGLCLFFSRYTLVGSDVYPKNTQALDLRGREVSSEELEKLREAFPEAEIQWEISFQGSTLSGDTTEVSLETLTEDEAQALASLPKLRSVRAADCRDFEALRKLKALRPEVQVKYHVPIGGKTFASDAVQLNLGGISPEEIDLLAYLPYVKTVTVSGGEPEVLKQLRSRCGEKGIAFRIRIGGSIVPEDTRDLTLEAASSEDVQLLYLLPRLEKVHFAEPAASGEMLVALAEALPDALVTWEKSLLGLTFFSDAEEIDLTAAIALGEGEAFADKTAYQHGADYPVLGDKEEIPSSIKVLKYHPLPDKTEITSQLIAEAEAAMAYFPKAHKLVMVGSILDNEAMSQFRERHREDYKVVWMVQCGDVATRTDATLFMPTKYHVYYFFDKDTPNLKYCEEIVSMDLGHMLVRDLSFVEYMPNLKYLILTLSDVRDITPLSTCKNLVFLEMDWTRVTDYYPLLGCTALEDLNIGQTFGDITPVLQMTWLKNLWLVGCENQYIRIAMKAMPDTHIGAFYDNPDDGWRQLPNYFKMRDALLMFYML